MPVATDIQPIEDSVPKINNELAVGSDHEFQRWWESLERIIWTFLIIFLSPSRAGAFGRGPLANTTANAVDGSMKVKYERVERFGTPSVLTVDINTAVVQNGKVQLWVGDQLVKPLGNQRVVPQPDRSEIGNGGVLYTFPASAQGPASVEFQTQPSSLGKTELKLRIPGHSELSLNIY